MTSEEKADVLQRALMAIDAIEATHTATQRRVAEVPVVQVSVSSTVSSAWYTYFMEKKFVPALSLSLLLLVTGGTSLAAEQALPGDVLYPVKIGLNEKVRGFTAITPEAKAKFALEVTDRRLKEVALLSSKGLLNEETSAMIQSQLVKQAGQIRNQVASLVSTKNIKAAQEISLNFESSLRAHELILEKISKKQNGEDSIVTASLPIDTSSSSDADPVLMSAALSSVASETASSVPTPVVAFAGQSARSVANPHIQSFIQTLRLEIATTTASRAELQQAEIQALNKESILSRISEMRLRAIGIKRIASTTPLASSLRASTTLRYIAESDTLIDSASSKVASSSLSEALFDIQKATQLLIDAEVLMVTESASDPALQVIINEALSVPSLSPVGQIPTSILPASSTSTVSVESTSSSSTISTSSSSTK